MRIANSIIATVLLVIVLAGSALGLLAGPAAADHRRDTHADNRWACRGIWLPHYRQGAPDPFAYKYCPRGYYPYYNSSYWRSRHEVGSNRARFHHPKYYKAWGASRKHYRHYRWHAEHHDRHDPAHW